MLQLWICIIPHLTSIFAKECFRFLKTGTKIIDETIKMRGGSPNPLIIKRKIVSS